MGDVTAKLQALGLDEDLGSILSKLIKRDKDEIMDWRKQARECYAFEAGDQWDIEDRAKLEEQGRPPVVFNRVARTVNAVAGLEIQNRQETRFLPREMTDTGTGELLTAAAKWARDNCDAEDEESDSFRDLLISGMGWTETRMCYEVDPEGEIIIDRLDPMEMGWDAASKKKNLDDANRIWRAREYPTKEAMERWPGATFNPGRFWTDGEEGDDIHQADQAWEYKNDQGAEANKDGTVTVVQVQWCERRMVHHVETEGGQLVVFDAERFERIADYVESKGLGHQRITKRFYYQAFMSGDDILEIGEAPCDGYTLRCMTGVRDRNENIWLGLVVYMIDPQRWANKWLSQTMYIMNTNAKGGLLAEEGAFVNPRQAEDDWASPDSIVKLNAGGLNKVKEKGQSQFPAGFYQLMETALEAITDVTGVSMEMLGLAGASNQVGIIEASRKQSGISLLAEYFNGLRRYRKEQGRVMAHFIREYISDGRLIRITGPTGQQYIPLMQQPGAIKYDIIVDDAPSSPNQKQQVFHIMMEMLPHLMAAQVPIPPEIIDYVPLPSSLIQKWKEYLANQGQDETADQAKMIALADKVQEIMESKSKEALNYAKAQSEGTKPVVDMQRARNDQAKTELAAVKTGADIANPGRGML